MEFFAEVFHWSLSLGSFKGVFHWAPFEHPLGDSFKGVSFEGPLGAPVGGSCLWVLQGGHSRGSFKGAF